MKPSKKFRSWQSGFANNFLVRMLFGKGEHSELLVQILHLFEDDKLYRNAKLRINDVARLCCTNRTYVSQCINSHYGKTFPMFVDTYRVEYAKQLIRGSGKDFKLAVISDECGFSGNAVFVRVFKKLTGMNPSEWRDNQR